GYSLTQDYHSLKGAFSDAQMEGLDPEGQAGRLASEWTAYRGSSRGDRYSPADLTTPEHVGRSAQSWEDHCGDLRREGDPGGPTNQVTPHEVGDRLFICAPLSIAIELDPDTAEERWRFDPAVFADAEYCEHITSRG